MLEFFGLKKHAVGMVLAQISDIILNVIVNVNIRRFAVSPELVYIEYATSREKSST